MKQGFRTIIAGGNSSGKAAKMAKRAKEDSSIKIVVLNDCLRDAFLKMGVPDAQIIIPNDNLRAKAQAVFDSLSGGDVK